MNPNKFTFIICTNNQTYIDECITYINLLNVPDGYVYDIITITDATSITSGYNSGQLSTNAKYKIYMHQDVFILNRNFLFDLLTIFNSNASIGLIGLVGYKCIPPTGTMWHEKRYGIKHLFGTRRSFPESHYSYSDYSTYTYNLNTDGITNVVTVDGLMMITQYDLPWNEFELKDWDFYDAYQSINYLEHGYDVVVPNQTFPWIIHDDGQILSMWNYNQYRNLFLEKYKNYIGLSSKEIQKLQPS